MKSLCLFACWKPALRDTPADELRTNAKRIAFVLLWVLFPGKVKKLNFARIAWNQLPDSWDGIEASCGVNGIFGGARQELLPLFPAGRRHYNRPNCHYDRPNPNYDRADYPLRPSSSSIRTVVISIRHVLVPTATVLLLFMFKKCLFPKGIWLLRWVEGGFGVFSRDAFSCKKILGGRESASNARLNESVDYIMLLKIFGCPNMERKSTDFMNKSECGVNLFRETTATIGLKPAPRVRLRVLLK